MTTSFDLDAYLERIGYTDDRALSFETLRRVHWLHATTFPFENINPLLGLPVPLDIASLQQKMVDNGRGGYCFEQNLLLREALTALGFQVTGLSARVLSGRDPGDVPPRTHMLLRVDFDGTTFIVDGGFGGMTLTEPIRLETDEPQPTSHERRRFVRDDDEFVMQGEIAGEWETLYRFNLLPQLLVDYQMANWYVSTWPDSQFTRHLIAARPTQNGRYALRDNSLAMHPLGGPTKRTLLTSASELRKALEDIFLIRLPDSPELETKLHRLAQKRPDSAEG